MLKLSIKSKIKNYHLTFDDSKKYLLNQKNINNIFVVDSFFKNKIKIISNKIIYIDSSEKTKSFENIHKIIKKLIKLNANKKTNLIVVGGGVLQDTAGFIASIYFRGLKWTFLPTTLLGMGDSCIGGKTSINFYGYKNQLGNFNPPDQILIDIKFLKTLPLIQIISGIGEMSHYFFVSSILEYRYFTNYITKIDYEKLNIKDLILKSLQIKKKIIEKDEFDKKERLLLNYGHSFGHALESYTKYKIYHGCAVVIGMMVSNYISFKLKFINLKQLNEMNNLLKSIYIERKINLNKIDINKYCNLLLKDKKNYNNNLRLILTRGPGKMFIYEIKLNSLFKNNLSIFFKNYYL